MSRKNNRLRNKQVKTASGHRRHDTSSAYGHGILQGIADKYNKEATLHNAALSPDVGLINQGVTEAVGRAVLGKPGTVQVTPEIAIDVSGEGEHAQLYIRTTGEGDRKTTLQGTMREDIQRAIDSTMKDRGYKPGPGRTHYDRATELEKLAERFAPAPPTTPTFYKKHVVGTPDPATRFKADSKVPAVSREVVGRGLTIDQALEWQFLVIKQRAQTGFDRSMSQIEEHLTDDPPSGLARHWSQGALNAIHGELFYVADDIGMLLTDAANKLPPNTKYTNDMLPVPNAVVMLEHPMAIHDPAEPDIALATILGFAWASAKVDGSNDSLVFLYATLYSTIDGGGYTSFAPIGGLLHGDEPGLYRFHMDAPDDAMCRVLYPCAGWVPNVVMSFLLFIRQTVLVTASGRASRPMRRRLEHAKHPNPDPLVRVVQLRKHQYRPKPADEKEAAEWSCRWIVGGTTGFWRNQWYPSKQIHQPKWVAPYIKGPDDKPLKPLANRVFAVVR